MQKKWVTTISITIIIGVIILASTIFSSRIGNSPVTGQAIECNTVQYHNEGAINLVFIGSEEKTKSLSEYLLDTTPFNEYPQSFNVHHIEDTLSPGACELYRGIAILCNDKEVFEVASACPHDYIFVLKDEHDKSIRSSAYENIVSINTKHNPSVIAHEFGHAFANLAEEYTPAKIPRGAPNCVRECADFSQKTKCFEGCSQGTYLRSIERGVMRTLSTNDFGEFNSQVIRSLIQEKTNTISANAAAEIKNCQQEEYMLVELETKDNEIISSTEERKKGCAPRKSNPKEFSVTTTSQGGVEEGKIYFSSILFTDGEGEIMGETFDIQTQRIAIPIKDSTTQLTVKQQNEIIHQINIDRAVGAHDRPKRVA